MPISRRPETCGRSDVGIILIPQYAILDIVKPDIIALGYDQEHAEERIREDLIEQGIPKSMFVGWPFG